MKELQTEDMVSLVEAVERDMVMEKVESHLKQSVTYERLQSCSPVRSLGKEYAKTAE
ncbi:hypothetical protein bthur0005_52800 [Bacillus thuringiensis serovar pakistani str. T13001]|nr:hypothetical protein bthur0005_52800 [Bacillus thuringiensis serovar pakistani str. T13001]